MSENNVNNNENDNFYEFETAVRNFINREIGINTIIYDDDTLPEPIKEFTDKIADSISFDVKDNHFVTEVTPINEPNKDKIKTFERLLKLFVQALDKMPVEYRKEEQKRQYARESFKEILSKEDLTAFGISNEPAELIPKIIAKELDKITFPIGKVNSQFWTLFEEAEKNGQIAIGVEKRGSKKEADVLYSINFEGLTGLSINKELTPYDKRVYVALGSLYNNGSDVITLSQIYTAMGNTSRPSSKDIEKLNSSITKLSRANIYIDNSSENNLYTHRKRIVYEGYLLPIERIKVYVGEMLTDGAVHLLREPPLTTFARERGQITTIKLQLLESPVSKTETNLSIDDYLLDRISQMKNNSKLPQKILYSTLFDNCKINGVKKRQRAKPTIKRYLDYYKQCGFIQDYKELTEGVEIKP